MKNVIIIILTIFLGLITSTSYSQCLSTINGSKSNKNFSYKYHDNPAGHWYISGEVDINNALDIDRTIEPRGWDYDIELGVRSYSFAYYFYYGEFKKIDYTNYGFGVDYYLAEYERLDILIGANIGVINVERSYLPESVSYLTYAPRIKTVFSISNSVGIFAVGKYQLRPDRDIHGIFEVSAGIQLYIN